VDLVNKLLKKDRMIRLGAGGDAAEILQHPWFASIDINELVAQRITPPYIPKVDSKNLT